MTFPSLLPSLGSDDMKFKRTLFFLLLARFVTSPVSIYAQQQTYRFEGLSSADVLTIGRGLDKLPREDTDRDNLYGRLQSQITAQDNAARKSKADAEKAAIDKAVSDAKAKADEETTTHPTEPMK